MSKPQIIDPSKFGRQTFEKPVFNADTVARADNALQEMSGSFQQWLEEEVARLQDARVAGDTGGWTFAAIDLLFGSAHDLKGLGATFEYPLATRIAASLCRLIETDAGKRLVQADPSLMLAHVDAIRAAARDHVKSVSNPMGRAVLQALEARVAELNVAPV